MLIAQISDTHILARGSGDPVASSRADNLRRTVASINHHPVDAVVFTGDTVQHGQPEEYATLCDLLSPLEAPLYLAPGNRDDKHALRAAFADRTWLPENGEFIQYSVERDDLRLIAIDSTSPGERKGVFCAAREAWLDRTLSERPNQPTLLFIHHPPFDVGDHYIGGYRRPEEASALTEVVERHPQVERLICGHVHCLVERKWAGTTASIMPSIAVDVRKDLEGMDVADDPVYMLHRMSAEDGLVSRVARAEALAE